MNQEINVTHSSERQEPERITVDQALAMSRSGERVLFLDTRAPDAWDESEVKIRGAMRVPVSDVERMAATLPRDQTIVTYCT